MIGKPYGLSRMRNDATAMIQIGAFVLRTIGQNESGYLKGRGVRTLKLRIQKRLKLGPDDQAF